MSKGILKSPLTGIVFILLVLAGCSSRERVNPLDPLNPETGGKPGGLSVISLENRVTLRWDFEFDGIDGFRIYRKTGEESGFSSVALVPGDESGFTDGDRAFDVPLAYRISVVSGDYESPLSDSVSITPGPHTYWILDYYASSLSRWTYDAGHLISNRGMELLPTAMALDTVTQTVWVLFNQGYMARISYEGEYLNWLDGFELPVTVGFNTATGTVWVADDGGSVLRFFSTSGVEIGSISGLGEISDIECAGMSGCWITDRKRRSLLRYGTNGQLRDQFESAFTSPGRVDFFEPGSWLWVADSLRLFRISTEGEILLTVDLERPAGDIDPDAAGNCWVIVSDPATGEGSLLKLSPEGVLLVRKDNLRYPLSVASVPHNGGCLVADTGNGRILRFSRDGEILHSLDGFPSPWQILVD